MKQSQNGAAALDCFAELVIGPATSGRTRWLAMTSEWIGRDGSPNVARAARARRGQARFRKHDANEIQFAENKPVRELNSLNNGSKPPWAWRGFFASRLACQRLYAS